MSATIRHDGKTYIIEEMTMIELKRVYDYGEYYILRHLSCDTAMELYKHVHFPEFFIQNCFTYGNRQLILDIPIHYIQQKIIMYHHINYILTCKLLSQDDIKEIILKAFTPSFKDEIFNTRHNFHVHDTFINIYKLPYIDEEFKKEIVKQYPEVLLNIGIAPENFSSAFSKDVIVESFEFIKKTLSMDPICWSCFRICKTGPTRQFLVLCIYFLNYLDIEEVAKVVFAYKLLRYCIVGITPAFKDIPTILWGTAYDTGSASWDRWDDWNCIIYDIHHRYMSKYNLENSVFQLLTLEKYCKDLIKSS
jgi:hypothetical protein